MIASPQDFKPQCAITEEVVEAAEEEDLAAEVEEAHQEANQPANNKS